MWYSTAWSVALQAADEIQVAGRFHGLPIAELLLFDSLARKTRGVVGDIDLLVLTSSCGRAGEDDDWEDSRYYRDDETCRSVHILSFPVTVLTHPVIHQGIARHQYDPNFLRNCFADMLRYDYRHRRFESVGLSRLERKFATHP